MYKVALLYHANEAKSYLISVAITTLHTHFTDDDIHPPFAKQNKQNKKRQKERKEKTKKMCHYYHYYCPSCDVLINTAMVRSLPPKTGGGSYTTTPPPPRRNPRQHEPRQRGRQMHGL